MLRVWGGAIYENDIFYQLCDRNGILVWQDFMFACALQPGDEQHLENIALEAEYNVKRLRNHPSLALWCGNNENLHGWHHWGWRESYEPKMRRYMWRRYERIFHDILPDAVSKHSGHVAYWASSPSGYNNRLADRRSGDEHDWTIWFGQRPFSDFGVNVPRFVSEYGLQAFPGMHTLRDFSVEEDWDIDSPVMRHRQRSKMEYIQPGFDGNDMIKRYMEWYYPVPENFGHFVYVSQLLQAKAYRMAIEAHRRNMPHCMGSLYWQLNDSWPTISWATVDFYGRWKAAHYAVQKANKNVMVSPVLNNNSLSVYVVNDHLKPFDRSKLKITFFDFEGNELSSLDKSIKVKANHSTLVFKSNIDDYIEGADLAQTLALVQVFNGDSLFDENILYFFEPKDLTLKKADIVIDAKKNSNGYALTLTADRLVKNIYMETPYPDDFFSDNFFDLVPNQPKTIQLSTKQSIDVATDISYLTLNDIQ
jgi:beta-mannosidase